MAAAEFKQYSEEVIGKMLRRSLSASSSAGTKRLALGSRSCHAVVSRCAAESFPIRSMMSEAGAQPLNHHIRIPRDHGRADPHCCPRGVKRRAFFCKPPLLCRQRFRSRSPFSPTCLPIHHELAAASDFFQPLIGGVVRVTHGGFKSLRQLTRQAELEHLFFRNVGAIDVTAPDDRPACIAATAQPLELVGCDHMFLGMQSARTPFCGGQAPDRSAHMLAARLHSLLQFAAGIAVSFNGVARATDIAAALVSAHAGNSEARLRSIAVRASAHCACS